MKLTLSLKKSKTITCPTGPLTYRAGFKRGRKGHGLFVPSPYNQSHRKLKGMTMKACEWCGNHFASKYCPICIKYLFSRVNEIATRLSIDFANVKEHAPYFIDIRADNFKLTTVNRAIKYLKDSGLTVDNDIDRWHKQANIVLSAPYIDL